VSELRLSSTAGRGTLLAAVLASGMAFLDGTVVNVALPHLGTDLGATLAGLQWTISGYTLALAALVLLGGALGDRYGRRRIFVLGVVWFTGASVLCGFAQSIGVLVAARVLQGIGAALLTPGSLALLQASFHPQDRARAIGAWSGLSGVSTAVGPLVGGWLIDTLSWRWIFFLNVPLAAVVLVAAARWVPESRSLEPETSQSPARFDIAGAVLAALGLAGVTYALIDAAEHGFGGWPVPVSTAVGVLAFVAFALVERRRGASAMLPPALFTQRGFTRLNLYTLVVYAALSGQVFFLVVQLQVTADYSALAAGLAGVPITVLLLVGSARAGALATRFGPRPLLVAGPTVAAAGLLLLLGVDGHTNYWRDVLPGVVAFGIGLTMLVAPLTASVLGAVPDRFAGVASGVNNAAARAAALLAVAALPLLVGLSGAEYADPEPLTRAYRAALLWCTGLLLLGALTEAVARDKAPPVSHGVGDRPQ